MWQLILPHQMLPRNPSARIHDAFEILAIPQNRNANFSRILIEGERWRYFVPYYKAKFKHDRYTNLFLPKKEASLYTRETPAFGGISIALRGEAPSAAGKEKNWGACGTISFGCL